MTKCRNCGFEFPGRKCQPCSSERERVRRALLRERLGPKTRSKDREITQELLRERFHYDPESGAFTRIKGFSHNAVIGAPLELMDKCGYLYLRLHKRRFTIHRLIWMYVHGTWPANIDHINGNRSDNRILNLRECTVAENACNTSRPTGISGYRGVYLDKRTGKWGARISKNRRDVRLGFFDDPKSAHEAYCEAAKQLHGEFAKLD